MSIDQNIISIIILNNNITVHLFILIDRNSISGTFLQREIQIYRNTDRKRQPNVKFRGGEVLRIEFGRGVETWLSHIITGL